LQLMQFNNPTSTKNGTKNMTTLHSRKSIGCAPLRRRFPGFLLALALAWFLLSPAAQAVTPPPDGGYPGRNTAEGDFALFSLDEAGTDNTAIGFSALYSDTFGSENTAIGSNALYSNIGGVDNTATGVFALYSNIYGLENTATGAGALRYNTIGNANTATGIAALNSNTTGSFNTATGGAALASNTTGNSNTANGDAALLGNTIGSDNTALGALALFNNTRGGSNTATGAGALYSNEIGAINTAIGVQALYSNTTGSRNTANGSFALLNNTTGSFNTADGDRALFNNTTGARNIALGFNAGVNLTTGNSNIDIGAPGVPGEASTIRIGVQGTQTRAVIAGINGSPITGTSVVVNSHGRLGTIASSQRFKNDIKPMDKASEAILALKPVTFHYKKEVDPDGIPQFGLVAEQVERVNPDLVTRDEEGKVYTVRYEAVNAMLLNEFLKEHRKVEKLEATVAQQRNDFQSAIAHQRKEMETFIAQLRKQAAQIQKVSAQLEVNKTAPQIVVNDH
jgi:hypothetical protein